MLKCWRVLYKPDNTAFMIWAENKDSALKKARQRNLRELEDVGDECLEDYLIDEFTPETNDTGILVFYDVYTTFKRNQNETF